MGIGSNNNNIGENPALINILEISKKSNVNNQKKGIAFFCLIPFPDKYNLLPILITNYRVIKDSIFKKKITFLLEDKNYEIELEYDRKVYLSEKYDITIIEIRKEDGLDINTFLEIDENIFKEDSNNNLYIKKKIFLLQNSKYSKGIIKYLNKDNFTFEYSSLPKKGDSGSPLIDLINYKVIGIHKESKEEYNYNIGIFIKKPILNFIKKKEIIGKLQEDKFKDEITIIYNRDIAISERLIFSFNNHEWNREKGSIYKLFGEEFVENNVDKCKMIINEKEYKLCSFLNENDEIKEDIFEIKLKGIHNIINAFGLFNGCLSLVSLPNISKWDTSNVTYMGYIFSRCCSLSYLDDISNWNTSKVRYMDGMFFQLQFITFFT